MERTKFNYEDDLGININIDIPEDVNLTNLMAYFIRFTQMIGYQAGSWENVIDDIIADGGLNDDYTIYEWADDKIVDLLLKG